MDSPAQLLRPFINRAGPDGNHSAIVSGAMIAIDTSALSLWLADRISTPQLFAMHVFAVGFLLGLFILLNRRARLPALLEAGFCILAGPLGTLILQIARLGQVLSATDMDDLEDLDNEQSKQVSVPDAIHEMHIQGRRSKPILAEDQSYADIIRHGDLLRHNEVIAAISRNYKPEMYPALSLALGSSSPALKVQAAAVFSKLRRTLGEAANSLLATDLATLPPETAQDYYDRVLNVARSGFVDAGKAQDLVARARAIEVSGLLPTAPLVLPNSDALHARQIQRDMQKQGPRLKRYSCGGVG